MSSADAQQQQQWPELDVRYFRWDPPVYPASSSAPNADAAKKGGKPRVESAFAHTPFPPKLTGWDPNPREAESAEPSTTSAQERLHGLGGEQQGPTSTGQEAGPAGQETIDFRGVPISFRQPATSQGGGDEGPAWAHTQQPQQGYGSSFDNLFALGSLGSAEPAGVRYGVPQGQAEQPAASIATASVGQSSAPFLTVQCGRFSAPVQREAPQPQATAPLHPTTLPMSSHLQRDFHAWSRQQESQAGGGAATQGGQGRVDRSAGSMDPALQDFSPAHYNMLEGIMRNHRQNAGYSNSMEPGLMDIFGPLQLGRAVSTLEAQLPSAHSLTAPGGGGGADLEPYMPQWQSESVPAELPNHVVDRLLMSGNHHALQKQSRHSRSNSLSGSKRTWGGLPTMPSIPDDRELPSMPRRSAPGSPSVDHLEELARTADLEVAHRAFLVPPHKKRGKGGRQPAADPRLDPNIDERKAKRILANRLSAARSKMKQKNQMDVLSGIIDQLEHHNKELHEDVAELMEVCETMEFANRAMIRDCHILEEFMRRRQNVNHA